VKIITLNIYKMLKMNMFEPFKFENFKVKNRVVMAPMTRSRAAKGDVPTPLMAKYYAQRASAGLIITEGAPISEVARGYSMTPGIYTSEQIEGWKLVTDSVHKNGGKIFIQLWHVGRMSHSIISGTQPMAPSAIKTLSKVYGPLGNGLFGKIDTETPKAMTVTDIKNTIIDFVEASKNAIAAGFDGVEIHGAHGYLIDQFLRKASNQRSDIYGGSIENRMRFLMEVSTAIANEIGADKVGLRISPFVNPETGKELDDEIKELSLELVKKLQLLNLAYLHFSENIANYEKVDDNYRKEVRKNYSNPIIICGGLTKNTGNQLIEKGLADMVAFGLPYITNPDLVERFKANVQLTELTAESNATFYGGGAEGYTDYPVYKK
jgi:N-ethylmaleimide reductase